jgi:hypothetical protein
VWDAAYRSIVDAELHQIIGRARSVLQEGCDVVVVSSQLICSDFLEYPEISLTAAQDRTWQVCREFDGPFAPGDIRRALPELSVSAVRLAVKRLLALGRIERFGTSGGRSTRYQLVTESQDVRNTIPDGGRVL